MVHDAPARAEHDGSPRAMRRHCRAANGWLATLLVVLAGCASQPPAVAPAPAPPPPRAEAPPPTPARAPYDEAGGQILVRGERQLVYLPVVGDSWRGIARRLLGDPGLDWSIAEANRVADMAPPAPGAAVLVPLVPRNPAGIHPDWIQTVPILCYHRFGPVATKMTITPQGFAQQLEHLAKNGWRVIPLAELRGFLDARKPLPPRTVVITIDDGYESVHRHAYPLLKKHGFPATLFVYTDFVGAPDGLSWSQLQEMQRSGLVDVQSHSKSHRNLIERSAAETDARYRLAIDAEMRVPRELLARRIEGTQVQHIAWPFGDANATVLEAAARNGFELGATVMPGGNAFYAQPLMLRRTMIFGDMDLDAFRARLQTLRSWGSP